MVPSLRKAIALLLVVMALGLSGCGGNRNAPTVLLEADEGLSAVNPLIGTLAEVSPPERIQQLKPFLDVYEPQVRIVSPKDNEVLEDTTVAVQVQVRDFPIYKDADLGLGPHLHLFLDDRPYQAVYDTDSPIVFENLAPGSHTLRVFASRPWHESFKNEGAYDQVTFNVFTDSPDHTPDESAALLTYSRPQGSYGAEPIMLDFYLSNAPLHIVAESDESVADWRIRCTVNGESFVFDRWQPLYLKGFRAGTNWVKLELIDENGNLIDNAFNPGIRLIEYTPGGADGLSRLIRGEIPLSQAKVLVDPTYVPPAPAIEAAPEIPEAAPPEAVPSPEVAPTAPEATEVAPESGEPEVEQPEEEEPKTIQEPTPASEAEQIPEKVEARPGTEPELPDTEAPLPTTPLDEEQPASEDAAQESEGRPVLETPTAPAPLPQDEGLTKQETDLLPAPSIDEGASPLPESPDLEEDVDIDVDTDVDADEESNEPESAIETLEDEADMI